MHHWQNLRTGPPRALTFQDLLRSIRTRIPCRQIQLVPNRKQKNENFVQQLLVVCNLVPLRYQQLPHVFDQKSRAENLDQKVELKPLALIKSQKLTLHPSPSQLCFLQSFEHDAQAAA